MRLALTWMAAVVLGVPLGVTIWSRLMRQSFWPEWASGYAGLYGWIFLAIVALFGVIGRADARMRKNLGTIGE